jgi:hypothetical protein
MYKWRGDFIFGRNLKDFLKHVTIQGHIFWKRLFKCSAVFRFNIWNMFVKYFWFTIDSGSCTWNQQIKLQLNSTICTAVSLYTCIQQMPVLTPAVPGVFFVSFCLSNQISWIGQRLVGKSFVAISFQVFITNTKESVKSEKSDG